MNLNIKKEDISINPDGTISILSPDLKAKIEKVSTGPDETVMWFDNCPINNYSAGCGVKVMAE